MIRHGISVGIERVNNTFFLSIKATGKLSHDDYKIIVPMLESAINNVAQPEINVLFDGSEFQGWELRAAWDDLKLGLKHGREFKKVAIYGNDKWLEITAKVGRWFISGKVKYFNNLDDALGWLA
ncbi:MAG: STAS/SEC14 domain-containing protein [Piscirickettsiaceae bacterium]|nr:MAG: STAS/SEC14 domain-containing protein [Piscirickettsiaceae bacterium]